MDILFDGRLVLGKEFVDHQNGAGWTTLHFFVSLNDTNYIRQTLEFGANPNIVENDGWR